MKVLKASAGSGKTYRLSKSYIEHLLSSDDRYAYRHLLAVTFTNKATAEMKGRILRDLYELSAENEKARRMLVDILHDYSAFSVSTIDRFFQQTLKAFSREIGQFSAYQVELDRDTLIQESMDRILDGLTEDKKDLVDWLKQSVISAVEQGRRFSIDDGLLEMGKRLKNEEYRELSEKYGIDGSEAFSKERLAAIRTSCRKVIDDFHRSVKLEAEAVAPMIDNARALGYLEPYRKCFKRWEAVPEPKKTLSKACPGSAFMELFEEPFRVYNTARLLEKLIFSMGLSGEFLREFDLLLKEKSVMPLDDSNTILRDIIDGSDAPFVYEKLGVRYESFLLDEFQDTSGIQWINFLPLLKESESKGGGSLIVGDIKQSIYRWRNSDWRLLGEEVGRQFPTADVEPLQFNWRSVRNVVDFNNEFFRFASSCTGTADIYCDVEQTVRSSDPQDGGVRVSFVEDQGKEILASVERAREAGALWNDIAVLVRNRKDGASVASLLIAEGIPVISDDSLSLKSSLVVRRLASLLHYFENPANSIGSYLALSMGVEFPSTYHSLVDLCEGMLRSLREYDPESFEGETLFIEAFMDDLQSWVEVNGNNLRYYLQHWDESDPYIGSPENSDSVRILTIHKSKGLEFPYVIFPFAEKVTLYKDDVHWCYLDASGTALGSGVNGLYPVNLSEASLNTLFADAYLAERRMQAVDNINVFYVALTRAVKYLHVISSEPSKKFRESLKKGAPVYMNFSEMLYQICGGFSEWQRGSMYDFTRMERKASADVEGFAASYPSIPLAGRLAASEDALDYFGEDGATGIQASARLKGIVLHHILSRVDRLSDLPGATDEAVRSGLLSQEEGDAALAELQARVAAHPAWFDDALSSRNEASLYAADGSENRPDRVVFTTDGLIVVDYKFGLPKASYERQVRRYMNIYRKMGYGNVSGAVWYVREDNVVEVK